MENVTVYVLKVIGARRSVLAYHTCDTAAELSELLSIYRALGYANEALIVEQHEKERAA